jgi:arylsulfatase A-like enzyme
MRSSTAFLFAAAAACMAAPPAAPAASPGRTTLVVAITVDQMRADYLPRFAAQLSGGLARLIHGGAWFPRGDLDYANTETAPGHATILSGRFPSHTGIVSNERGVSDSTVHLVGSRGPGASPWRFRGTTLFDWIRAAEPAARALSVSRKDRAAILPLGRARQAAFWYAEQDGRFTTSTYYADTLPSWVRAFNARRLPQQLAGRTWTLLLPDSAYPEPDAVPIESGGRNFVFPHLLPEDSARAAAAAIEYPQMDEITLAFALAGVEAMGLGQGPATDLLSISLSSTDAIGHRYGPDSREIHDQVLRLDRALGTFIDSLFRLRDSTRIVIVLTGDHGVAPFPELYAARPGQPAGHASLRGPLTEIRGAVSAHGAPASAFRIESAALWVDEAPLRAAGLDADSLVAAFATLARRVPGIARVDRVGDLSCADTVHDTIARRWYHALPPDLPIAAVVTLEPHWVWGRAPEAQHGGPHDYDTHVPLVLYGPPFRAGRYPNPVRVVDLAPTIAAAIGVRPTGQVDGHTLREALNAAAPPSAH